MDDRFFKTDLFNEYCFDGHFYCKNMPVYDIHINHPLSEEEYEDLTKFIDNIEGLSQIVFDDTVNPQTITRVKYMIETSKKLNDPEIQKLVSKIFKGQDLEDILNIDIANPESWQFAYREAFGTHECTDINKYRGMEIFLSGVTNTFNQNNLSPLEKTMWAYDIAKRLDYKNKKKEWHEKRIPEVLADGKATCVGFGELFLEILNRNGIKSYGVHTTAHEEHYRVIADINDEKYGVNGIYMFDPTWDSLSKDKYGNDDYLRLMPYDFFCRNISDLKLMLNKETPHSLLDVLSSNSLEEALEKARQSFPNQKDYGTRDLTLDDNTITEMFQKTTAAPKLEEEALARCMTTVRSKQYPNLSNEKIVEWVGDTIEQGRTAQEAIYSNQTVESKEIS